MIKSIEGYDKLYGITMSGQVWSYRSGKYLSPFDRGGYCKVTLCVKFKRKYKYVHRLVAAP